MTPEQEHLFVEVAQLGIACGLEHPYEWFSNAERNMDLFTLKPELRGVTVDQLIAAFTAFYRGTAGGPDEPVETWTEGDFLRAADSWNSYQNGDFE